jgi:hypothetical protein
MEALKEPEVKHKVKNSEINELKNIKYKTSMLTNKQTAEKNDINHLELFLENEKSANQSEPWNKLDKTTKHRKLQEFAEQYSNEKKLTEKEKEDLVVFLKDAVDKKKIYKVKDIIYDKENNIIKEIPGLVYLKTDHKSFTLKNVNTKMSTLKMMPKKKV